LTETFDYQYYTGVTPTANYSHYWKNIGESDKSIEEKLNDNAAIQSSRFRLQKLTGRIQAVVKLSESVLCAPILEVWLVLSNTALTTGGGNTPTYEVRNTFSKAASRLCQMRVKSIAYDTTTVDQVLVLYEGDYSYKVPKGTKGILESDEHLDEPETRTYLICLYRGIQDAAGTGTAAVFHTYTLTCNRLVQANLKLSEL
jgi:hypothetical protein